MLVQLAQESCLDEGGDNRETRWRLPVSVRRKTDILGKREVTDKHSDTARQLIELGKAARVYDLGQPSHAGMPQLPGAPRYILTLLRRHGDIYRGEGLSSANELVVSICHAGTHIDAIGHISVNGKLYGGISVQDAQVGVAGLTNLGIETVAPIVRRGVLLDVAGLLGVAALEPAQQVKASLLAACAERAGVSIEPGDVVLVRTGWGQFWDDPDRYVSLRDGLPGTSLDGARWLAERGIFATGADCLMYESFHPSDNRLPVHAHLIQQHGIHLIENLYLEELSRDGLAEFLLVVLPLKLVGATGSPVRPIALG